ncbi:MAG TPA: MnhB domain-containing protein [Acidimicrobiia bacterium]|nr:MnhB domain-containing protein [Acidimicrobiia bacterium]
MSSDRSLIFKTSVGLIFHTAVLFAFYLLFAGHNSPGGGFIGGLVAGAAFVLRYLDSGTEGIRATLWRPGVLLGFGLALAVVAGATGWMGGGQFLEHTAYSAELPALGTVKVTTALLFDIGVFLVVVGLVRLVLSVLGEEAEER